MPIGSTTFLRLQQSSNDQSWRESEIVFGFKERFLSNYQLEHDDKHTVGKVCSLCSSWQKARRKSASNGQITSSNPIEVVFPALPDENKPILVCGAATWFVLFRVDSQTLCRLFVHAVQGSPSYCSNRKWPPNVAGTDLRPWIAVSINLPTLNDRCEVISCLILKNKTTSFRGKIDLSNGVFLLKIQRETTTQCLLKSIDHYRSKFDWLAVKGLTTPPIHGCRTGFIERKSKSLPATPGYRCFENNLSHEHFLRS